MRRIRGWSRSFLASHQVAGDARRIYERIPAYVAGAGTARLFSARTRRVNWSPLPWRISAGTSTPSTSSASVLPGARSRARPTCC